jgi:hypothetical protein
MMNLEFKIRHWNTERWRGAYVNVWHENLVICSVITPAIVDDFYNQYVDVYESLDGTTKRIGEWNHQYESVDQAIADFKEFSLDYIKVMGEQNAFGII